MNSNKIKFLKEYNPRGLSCIEICKNSLLIDIIKRIQEWVVKRIENQLTLDFHQIRILISKNIKSKRYAILHYCDGSQKGLMLWENQIIIAQIPKRIEIEDDGDDFGVTIHENFHQKTAGACLYGL